MFKRIVQQSSIAIVLVLVSLGGYAKDWKFNNGLPEGRGESKQLDTFAADVA